MNQQIPTVSTDPADVAKVRELMAEIDIAMLTSVDSQSGTLVSRPLSTQTAEDDGDVLFLVRRDSAVVRDITANPQVNVAYASKKAWVSLAGRAAVIDDRAEVERLWTVGARLFMEGGPENPDNVVLKVSGETAQYWGGESLVATAVKMVKAMAGRSGDDDSSTTVQLP